jgi:hypothetical protein
MGQEIEMVKAEKDCDPIILNSDLAPNTKAVDGSDLIQDDIAYPCGLIAKSVFTDKY